MYATRQDVGCAFILLVFLAYVGHAQQYYDRKNDIQSLFNLFDTNGDGEFTPIELRNHFLGHDSSESTLAAKNVVSVLDADGDGKFTVEDMQQVLLSSSSMSNNINSYKIEQIKIALTGVCTEMNINFVIKNTPKPLANILVQVKMPNDKWVSYNTTYNTYTVPSRWWEPHGWNGYVYTADTIVNLVPGKEYSYRIVSTPMRERNDGEVGNYIINRTNLKFQVPYHYNCSNNEDGNLVTNIALWGDMGTYAPLGFKVFEKIYNDYKVKDGYKFNVTILFGDISYAGLDTDVKILNVTKADEWEYVWDIFGNQIEPLSSKIPFMVGVGNHDMFYQAAAFQTRFQMPYKHSKGLGNFWYSYDIGLVHIISASSEHEYDEKSEQIKWLIEDLKVANRNRNKIPWIVFTIHRPIYCSDANEYNNHRPGCKIQQAFEPLLLQYKVDLVTVGHEHCYERTHPVVNGTVVNLPKQTLHGEDMYTNPKAPIYVVVGTAGAFQHEKWVHPAPVWSAKRFANGNCSVKISSATDNHTNSSCKYTDTFGYGHLHIKNSSYLKFEFVPITGSVSDSFVIIK